MSEGLPIEVTCRVVGVSVTGFYMWRRRKPSARAVRHAMVAEVIRQVHDESRQTYGARRAHAELVLGRKMTVARCTVELVILGPRLIRTARLLGNNGGRPQGPDASEASASRWPPPSASDGPVDRGGECYAQTRV